MSRDAPGAPRPSGRAVVLAYALTLAALLLGSLFPEARVWGLDPWAWLPAWVPWTLFALGLSAALPLPAALLRRRLPAFVPAFVAGMTGLFFLLRSRYHFDGDGYQLLSDLSTGAPFLKSTGRGEGLLHLGAARLLGGAELHAEAAYQGLSIAAGALFVVLAAAFAKAWLADARDRALFVVAVSTGGFAALFFGHVENYSVLTLSVATVCAAGALAARGRIPAGLVLIPFAAAVWLHRLGWALAPGVAWLLLRRLPVIRGIPDGSRARRIAVVGVAAVVAAWGLVELRRRSLFLELALLPLLPDRFTVDGYTLFSAAHLTDLANLLLLLVPGLPVLVAAIAAGPAPRARDDRDALRFLAVLAAGCGAAVAVLDPKLGMPRDWDAFAFAGVPVAFLAVLAALARGTAAARRGVALASVLGALALFPRAAANLQPESAVARFRSRLELDPGRSRNSWLLLAEHYRRRGDEGAAALVRQEWEHRYPERALVREGQRLDDAGDVAGAIRKNREALERSPQYFDAYNNLGVCFYRTGDLAEARRMLEIAVALNPGAIGARRNLAAVCDALGDSAAAERARHGIEPPGTGGAP